MAESIFDICDRISPFLLDVVDITESCLSNKQTEGITLSDSRATIKILIADGYLIRRDSGTSVYFFTSAGRQFILKGGYATKFREDKEKEDLQKSQIQSVIDTNKSVHETNRTIKKTAWLTIWIVGITLLVSIVQLIISLQSNEESTKEVNKPVKQLPVHQFPEKKDSIKK